MKPRSKVVVGGVKTKPPRPHAENQAIYLSDPGERSLEYSAWYLAKVLCWDAEHEGALPCPKCLAWATGKVHEVVAEFQDSQSSKGRGNGNQAVNEAGEKSRKKSGGKSTPPARKSKRKS